MRTLALLLMVLLGVPLSGSASSDIELRVRRLEQQLENRALLDMLQTLQSLQQEVQQLRGELDVQNHQLAALKERQREFYVDIDKRLQQLQPAAPKSQDSLTGDIPPVSSTADTQSPPEANDVSTESPAAVADPAAGGGGLAKEAYKNAFALLNAGKYVQAKQAFTEFLTQYPSSEQAVNALYWLGESYYVTGDFDNAISTFNKVVLRYGNTAKAADAMLKLGYGYYEKGQWQQAKSTLNQLQLNYPQSTAARLARQRIEKIQQEGH